MTSHRTLARVLAVALLLVSAQPSFSSGPRQDHPSNPVRPDRIVFRLVDEEGAPVENAVLGEHADWSNSSWQRMLGIPPTPVPRLRQQFVRWQLRSDRSGDIDLAAESVISPERPPGHASAVYAWHPVRELVGVTHVTRESFGRRVPVLMTAGCRVRGTVTSRSLAKLGQGLFKIYVRVESTTPRRLVVDANTCDGNFEFLLPVGDFLVSAWAENEWAPQTQRVPPQSLTIRPGERHRFIEFELPAARIAHLWGRKAPELRGIGEWYYGDPVTLSDLNGHVILLSFVPRFDKALWPSRRTSLAHLADLHDRHSKDGLTIIAIKSRRAATLGQLERSLRDATEKLGVKGLPFRVAIDGVGVVSTSHTADETSIRSTTSDLYGVERLPLNLLLDRQGILIRGFTLGDRSDEERLDELLSRDSSEDRRPRYTFESGQKLTYGGTYSFRYNARSRESVLGGVKESRADVTWIFWVLGKLRDEQHHLLAFRRRDGWTERSNGTRSPLEDAAVCAFRLSPEGLIEFDPQDPLLVELLESGLFVPFASETGAAP